MVQRLFIVAPGNRADFDSLTRVLASDPAVQVVYDRRRARSRRSGSLGPWSRRTLDAPAERRADGQGVDEQLRARGWAVVKVAARA